MGDIVKRFLKSMKIKIPGRFKCKQKSSMIWYFLIPQRIIFLLLIFQVISENQRKTQKLAFSQFSNSADTAFFLGAADNSYVQINIKYLLLNIYNNLLNNFITFLFVLQHVAAALISQHIV